MVSENRCKGPEYLERTMSWNPWHGCHRVSEGCRNCYMFIGDNARGIFDSNVVKRSKMNFDLPLKKGKNGLYVVRDRLVLTSMTSDFFIEEADEWRPEAWDIIRKRKDISFLILTKRPERIEQCLPEDWGDGWDNVRLSVSVENQEMWDKRVNEMISVPAKHYDVFVAPMIGEIDISALPDKTVECLYVGGEYLGKPRPCRLEWIMKLREECLKKEISMFWRHCGETLIANGVVMHFDDIEKQVEYCMRKNLDVKFTDPMPKSMQMKLY